MTDFAWLIEAPGQRYLAVRQLSSNPPDFYWTQDANAALRFWSREQADLAAGGIRTLNPDLWGFALTLGEAWPREHGWLPPAPSSEAPSISPSATTTYSRDGSAVPGEPGLGRSHD